MHPHIKRAGVTPNVNEILEDLPLAVMVFDKKLNIIMANAAAEQLLGLSAGLLIRQCLTNLLDEDGTLISLIQQVFEEKHSVAEYGLSLAGPKIGKQKVDVRIRVLTENSDFVIVTIQECSIAQEVNNQDSQGRVARSMAGLATVFVNEIKNPLSGIRGASQLLEQSASDADKELTTLICVETDRIRNLVDEIEVFSDARPLSRTAVNIHDVLEHVKKQTGNHFRKNIEIQERYDPSLPMVFGNREQLIQVFVNLSQNAYEAITGRTGVISFETSYRHSSVVQFSGGRRRLELPIAVTVKDTGKGVPEDLKHSVFEPFVTTKPNATGLGLALVAKIIDDHGGIIELRTDPKNTEVCVYLPVCPNENWQSTSNYSDSRKQ